MSRDKDEELNIDIDLSDLPETGMEDPYVEDDAPAETPELLYGEDETADTSPELLVTAPKSSASPELLIRDSEPEDADEEADEETDERENTGRKRRILPVILIVIVLLVVIALAAILPNRGAMDWISRFFRYTKSDEKTLYSFSSYGLSTYAMVDDRLAVGNSGSITLFSSNGEPVKQIQKTFNTPLLRSTDSLLLVTDIGGKKIELIGSDGNPRFEDTVNGQIIDGDIAKNGYSTVLYTTEDARAVLETRYTDGTVLFRHTSKTQFFNCCTLSPEGTYTVAVSLGQENISYVSTALIYQTASEQAPLEIPLGSQIIYDIAAVTDEVFCAIGESGAVFFSADGNQLGVYDFEDSGLVSYQMISGKVILITDRYQTENRYAVLQLRNDGTVAASAQIDSTPLALSVNNGYTAVLTNDDLIIYNASLNKTATHETNGKYASAVIRPDGTALLISGGEAVLYIP